MFALDADLRARHYDTASAQFASRDPFQGRNDLPQSLHSYAYVLGDPINNADPLGLAPPVVLRFGNEAHRVIGEFYQDTHRGNTIQLNKGLPGAAGLLRPDIRDLTLGEIAEIKPLSIYGLTGYAQLAAYLLAANMLAAPHQGTGPWVASQWSVGVNALPTAMPSKPIVVVLFNDNGVVFYTDPSLMKIKEYAEKFSRALEKVWDPIVVRYASVPQFAREPAIVEAMMLELEAVAAHLVLSNQVVAGAVFVGAAVSAAMMLRLALPTISLGL